MTTERRNPQDPMIEEQNDGQIPESDPRQNQDSKDGDRQTQQPEQVRGEFPNDGPPEDEGDFVDQEAGEQTGEPLGSSVNPQRIEDRQTGYRSGESSGPG